MQGVSTRPFGLMLSVGTLTVCVLAMLQSPALSASPEVPLWQPQDFAFSAKLPEGNPFLVSFAATVHGPDGDGRVIGAVSAVLEGAAVSAADPGWVGVHRAQRGISGDDVLVDVAGQLLADGHEVIAVSADRGLRARWDSLPPSNEALPAQVVGPRWLLDVLDVLDRTTAPGR